MSINNLVPIFIIILIFIILLINLNITIVTIIAKFKFLLLIPLFLNFHSSLETILHHRSIQKYLSHFFHLKLPKIPY